MWNTVNNQLIFFRTKHGILAQLCFILRLLFDTGIILQRCSITQFYLKNNEDIHIHMCYLCCGYIFCRDCRIVIFNKSTCISPNKMTTKIDGYIQIGYIFYAKYSYVFNFK